MKFVVNSDDSIEDDNNRNADQSGFKTELDTLGKNYYHYYDALLKEYEIELDDDTYESCGFAFLSFLLTQYAFYDNGAVAVFGRTESFKAVKLNQSITIDKNDEYCEAMNQICSDINIFHFIFWLPKKYWKAIYTVLKEKAFESDEPLTTFWEPPIPVSNNDKYVKKKSENVFMKTFFHNWRIAYNCEYEYIYTIAKQYDELYLVDADSFDELKSIVYKEFDRCNTDAEKYGVDNHKELTEWKALKRSLDIIDERSKAELYNYEIIEGAVAQYYVLTGVKGVDKSYTPENCLSIIELFRAQITGWFERSINFKLKPYLVWLEKPSANLFEKISNESLIKVSIISLTTVSIDSLKEDIRNGKNGLYLLRPDNLCEMIDKMKDLTNKFKDNTIFYDIEHMNFEKYFNFTAICYFAKKISELDGRNDPIEYKKIFIDKLYESMERDSFIVQCRKLVLCDSLFEFDVISPEYINETTNSISRDIAITLSRGSDYYNNNIEYIDGLADPISYTDIELSDSGYGIMLNTYNGKDEDGLNILNGEESYKSFYNKLTRPAKKWMFDRLFKRYLKYTCTEYMFKDMTGYGFYDFIPDSK